MNPLEFLAVALILVNVWLTTRQSLLCWPVGLCGVLLYSVIFFEARLYSDVVLQAIFAVLQVYGWIHWKRGDGKTHSLPITRLKPSNSVIWCILGLAGTGGLGLFMARFTDAALPYWDAAIASFSLIAQYLLARKILENWLIWIGVDVVAVGVYATKGLYPTVVLYVVLLLLSVRGFQEWKADKAVRSDAELA